MPSVTDSLSLYKSPNFDLDLFKGHRDGKSRSSYIYGSHFNKIASALIATQQRFVAVAASASTSLNITSKFRFDAASSGSNLPSEFFWAVKVYSSDDALKSGTGYENRPFPERPGGPLLLSRGMKLTVLNSNLKIRLTSLSPTPYPPRGTYYSLPSSWQTGIKRVIIGSSRAEGLGTQYRTNKEVYNGTLPTTINPSAKTILGPGALMVSSTFFIPPEFNIANADSRYRFAASPGLNSGPMFGRVTTSRIISHVLVFGEAP